MRAGVKPFLNVGGVEPQPWPRSTSKPAGAELVSVVVDKARRAAEEGCDRSYAQKSLRVHCQLRCLLCFVGEVVLAVTQLPPRFSFSRVALATYSR